MSSVQSHNSPRSVEDRLGTVREADILSRILALFSRRGDALSDESIRSRERSSRAILTGFTSIFSKVVVLVSPVISVPLTFRYLGDDRYGLWMTITSTILFLGLADLGVGKGLAAAISEADGKDDIGQARKQVSCAFFLLLGIGICILLVLSAIFMFVPWGSFYGVKTALAAHEAGPATAILIVCVAFSMPLDTVLRVQLGLQQGFIGDLWNAAGNLLALGGILLVTHMHGGLPLLVCAVAGCPVLMTAGNWLMQFYHVRPWLRPSISLFDRETAFRLARVGSLFFIQQCFGLIYYASDNFVIARNLGAAQVASYAVMQRIFSIGLITQYFMVALWPAIGEALARKDFAWAHRIIRRAVAVSLIMGSVCSICLLLASPYLVKRWTGVNIGRIDFLRVGFSIWVVLVGYIAAMNAILNQPGVMRRHLVLFGAGALISLALKIFLVRYWSVAGVVWGTVIGYGVFYVFPATRLAFASVSIDKEMPA